MITMPGWSIPQYVPQYKEDTDDMSHSVSQYIQMPKKFVSGGSGNG